MLPEYFQSHLLDNLQKPEELTPFELSLNNITFKIARHFGFCFGVQNALKHCYKIIENNHGKNIFLISEIIHNPTIKDDLISRGVRLLMSSKGETLIPLETVSKNDIVIIPAFGITRELKTFFINKGIAIEQYDTTCPFVQKVWAAGRQIAQDGFTVVIHGTPTHEETKATFSQIHLDNDQTATLIIRDKNEAKKLAEFIGAFAKQNVVSEYIEKTKRSFFEQFKYHSPNFNPQTDLQKIGIIQQTTMLANETEEIINNLKNKINSTFSINNFADTKQTLCYATYKHQEATIALCQNGNATISLVIGGYNSSNTKHLAEISAKYLPTFFIKDRDEILSKKKIRHFDILTNKVIETIDWFPDKKNKNDDEQVIIAVSAGASCPNKVIEDVMNKIAGLCILV